MSEASPHVERKKKKSKRSSERPLSMSVGGTRASCGSSSDGVKGTFASKQAMLEKVYKEADSISISSGSPSGLAAAMRTKSSPGPSVRTPSPSRSGKSRTRLGTMKRFLKRSSANREAVSDASPSQNEEKEQRLLAKTHFARAATVLYPVPKPTKATSDGRKVVDVSDKRIMDFVTKCKEKAENAAGGLGITPSIVNELPLLIQQFPSLPPAMFSPLLTLHDGNLYDVQCHLIERGWATASQDASRMRSLSYSVDRPAFSSICEPEFSDERDPHFSTLYYCGRVSDIRKVVKLILSSPPGAYCTFFTQSGRSYQYQALYKLPQDVYEDFTRTKSMYVKQSGVSDSIESGAVVHESIVSPKVYGGWRVGRRLDKPLRNHHLRTAAEDVPLLLDKIRAAAKRKEQQNAAVS